MPDGSGPGRLRHDQRACGQCADGAARPATATSPCCSPSADLGQAAGPAPARHRSKAQAKKMPPRPVRHAEGMEDREGLKRQERASNFPGAKKLASCIGVPSRLINANPPEVDSPVLREQERVPRGPGQRLGVPLGQERPRPSFAAMANTKTPACMTTIMNGAFKAKIHASAGKGAKLGTITVTRPIRRRFARHHRASSCRCPITAEGISVTANITAVYYVKGKFGQEIDFNAYGSAFPTCARPSP